MIENSSSTSLEQSGLPRKKRHREAEFQFTMTNLMLLNIRFADRLDKAIWKYLIDVPFRKMRQLMFDTKGGDPNL